MKNTSTLFPPLVKRYVSITIAVGTFFALNACSSLETAFDNKVDYRSSSDNLSRNPLEIPPDLTRPGSTQNPLYSTPGTTSSTDQATLQQIQTTQASTILPSSPQAKVIQEGSERWLIVNLPAEKVWPQVREFWINQGFALVMDNPTIGILETDWLENRAKLPQDWVRKMIGKVIDNFMSTGEMDKYRTRIERGVNNSTEIFISHRGMIEVFKSDGAANRIASTETQADTIWTPRPADPELEAEMLGLLLQQLGVQAEIAKTTIANPEIKVTRTTIVDNNQALLLEDTFDRAWRRVGLALDRIGYVVVDRNRAEGIYYVRRAAEDIAKAEKSGFLASLAFWKTKENTQKITDLNLINVPEFEVQVTETKGKTWVRLRLKNDTDTQIDSSVVLNRLLTELK